MSRAIVSLAAVTWFALLLVPALAQGDEDSAGNRTAAAGASPAGPSDGSSTRSPDRTLVLSVGGDIQADLRAFPAAGGQSYPDQFLLRRVRPRFRGTFQRIFDFMLQVNVAGGRVLLLNTFVEARFAPWARLRVGKFIVPFGLELQQSPVATTFMEYALPSNLAPYFSVGLALHGEVAAVAFYQLALTGVVPDGATIVSDVADQKEGAARLFVFPFRRSGVAELAGIGIGASATYGIVRGNPTATGLPTSYKTDGRNDFFTYIVTTDKVTGKVDPMNSAYADGAHLRWSVQGNYLYRQLGLQAEHIRSTQRVHKGTLLQTPRNWAWHATAALVLTGENASFKGIIPARVFDTVEGGWGAIEVAARYAQLKVDEDLFIAGFADRIVSSREAWAWAAGANWYLNGNVRVSADYVRTTFSQGASTASGQVADRAPESAVLMRVQMVF
jgi:phosphate-selective porin OprO/OprP